MTVSEKSPWIRSTSPLPLAVSRSWSAHMCLVSRLPERCWCVRSRVRSDAIPQRDINSDLNLVTMAVIVAVAAYGAIGGETDGRRQGDENEKKGRGKAKG